MSAFERVITDDCLIPLVKTKSWDYFIIWKLGDDPSRFFQWKFCCCSGAFADSSDAIKQETGEEEDQVCKDTYNHHLATTNSCSALAQIPSFISLYSGVHGEAVISKETKWLNNTKPSTSNNPSGTHVLIPLTGSLVELFTKKQVARDQKIIDFVSSQCSMNLDNEAMFNQTSDIFSGFERSSSSSNFSNGNKRLKIEPVQLSCNVSPETSNVNVINVQQDVDFGSRFNFIETKHKTEGNYHSKNLITERNRRNRIKNGLFVLRSLVPNITKMDKISILGDACDYIKELQLLKKNYEDELKEMENENHLKNPGSEIQKSNKKVESKGLSRSNTAEEVQVEVSQISTTSFLLRIICKQRIFGFSMLMEIANKIGFQVIDVNVTTLDGMVMNILKVETNKKNIEAESLKDFLTKLIAHTHG